MTSSGCVAGPADNTLARSRGNRRRRGVNGRPVVAGFRRGGRRRTAHRRPGIAGFGGGGRRHVNRMSDDVSDVTRQPPPGAACGSRSPAD